MYYRCYHHCRPPPHRGEDHRVSRADGIDREGCAPFGYSIVSYIIFLAPCVYTWHIHACYTIVLYVAYVISSAYYYNLHILTYDYILITIKRVDHIHTMICYHIPRPADPAPYLYISISLSLSIYIYILFIYIYIYIYM